MKIVTCHNYYQQRGGEDQVFEDERRLLAQRGHTVVSFTRNNDSIVGLGTLRATAGAVWNRSAVRELGDVVRNTNADIAHFHNWLPLISPAAMVAARRAGAAVVQTLHNYRYICPRGTLSRDGAVCEECVGKAFAWPAVRYGCYRQSRPGSAVVAATLAAHRARGTLDAVDGFIALSQFAAAKLAAAGIDPDRVHIKPNFVDPDPGVGDGTGGHVMYLGRLAPEKGVETLLAAWERLPRPVPLKISGQGPLEPDVLAAADRLSSVEYLGFAPNERVDREMKAAAFLVMPSTNYEGFPKTVADAFARGTPIVASRLGALAELVEDGATGRHFTPGDADDLAATVDRLFHGSPETLRTMRAQARQTFVDRYGAEKNYGRLIEIYEHAVRRRREVA